MSEKSSAKVKSALQRPLVVEVLFLHVAFGGLPTNSNAFTQLNLSRSLSPSSSSSTLILVAFFIILPPNLSRLLLLLLLFPLVLSHLELEMPHPDIKPQRSVSMVAAVMLTKEIREHVFHVFSFLCPQNLKILAEEVSKIMERCRKNLYFFFFFVKYEI